MHHHQPRRLWQRGVPLVALLLWTAFSSGCTSSNGNARAQVGGTIALTATNAAAVGGLAFRFVDGAVLGFAGQEATLTLGADGATFTLSTSGGARLSGTLTFGSCTLAQTPPLGSSPAPLFLQTYATCHVTGASKDNIEFGGTGPGTIALLLGQGSNAPSSSDVLNVIYSVDLAGRVTINATTTPIGTIG